MRLNLDTTVFEEQQALLVRELVQSIRVKLQEVGLAGSQLEDTTAGIAFSVASMLDDTAAIEVDGTEVHPYLTFRTADDALTHCGENSYMHEFVYEVLRQLDQESKE
ncbi:hypothetical protein [uncultured Thiohalocapsa sp.]|jgi:hypothetical protein|uniref:hypothetical protein n=1 Tax=uncultured Thiohalocapsa sp. TaxID=768990 RepID=UPI0025DE8B01|nr:hypothetical protein [uncultured Thiohalocapsa sp.]